MVCHRGRYRHRGRYMAALVLFGIVTSVHGQVLTRLTPPTTQIPPTPQNQRYGIDRGRQPSLEMVRDVFHQSRLPGDEALAEPAAPTPEPVPPSGQSFLPADESLAPSQCDGNGVLAYGPSAGLDRCWFGTVSGLFMTRDNDNPSLFSYDGANEAIQLTNGRDANFDWAGGGQVSFGRYFACRQRALEAVYWGLYPDSNSTFTTASDVGGGLNAILNFDQLDYNGLTADNFTNNAQRHEVFRDNEVHNVEINLLHFGDALAYGQCRRLYHSWIVGARFFRFRDDLSFASDPVDQLFTGAVDELYYDIDIDNNLIGFQFGSLGRYAVTKRLRFDFGLKLGVFGNHIRHRSEIGGAAGTAVINNGPNVGRQFLVDNYKNDVAMLSEANLGLGLALGRCWTLTGGYRAAALTGVAFPASQIFADLRGIQDVEIVDSNGSLILHGGYLGLEYNF